MRIPLMSLALVATLASPALAVECAAGYVKFEARVTFPASMGRIVRVNQYAWGRGGIVHVCDLTYLNVRAGRTSLWQMMSEEIQVGNRAQGIPFYDGVCFEAVNSRNERLFSCRDGGDVFAGGAHFRGGSYATMPFTDWRAHIADFLRP